MFEKKEVTGEFVVYQVQNALMEVSKCLTSSRRKLLTESEEI